MSHQENLACTNQSAESRCQQDRDWALIIDKKIEGLKLLEAGSEPEARELKIIDNFKTLRQSRADRARGEFQEDFERHIAQDMLEAEERGITIDYPVDPVRVLSKERQAITAERLSEFLSPAVLRALEIEESLSIQEF